MRTRPRNRWERVTQVARWLNEEFDLYEEGAVLLRVEKVIEPDPGGRETTMGLTFEHRGRLVVALSERGCRTTHDAVSTILHEMAHVALWDTGRGLKHGKEFWITYGRFDDAYTERGYLDSQSYSVE